VGSPKAPKPAPDSDSLPPRGLGALSTIGAAVFGGIRFVVRVSGGRGGAFPAGARAAHGRVADGVLVGGRTVGGRQNGCQPNLLFQTFQRNFDVPL
jgi:hypothetical protein